MESGDEKQQRSFETLKQFMIQAPAVVQSNFEKMFYIVADASTIGVAGYLGQGELADHEIIVCKPEFERK